MSKSKKDNPIYPENKPKKVREKFNWKPYIIIFSVIALIFGIVAVNVFLVNGFFSDYAALSDQVEFEYIRGTGYRDTESGITYLPAPSYYEPASIVQEPVYGRIGKVSLFKPGEWENIDHLYAMCYPIGDRADQKYERVDPTVWLATDSNHGSTVYYNENFTLPDPKDFQFDTMYICNIDGTIAVQELDTIASADLMEDFFDGESENLYESLVDLGECIYSVRVTSTRYSWLHLVLYLYTYGEEYYLYLPELRRYVKTDTEIFDIYFSTPDDLEAAQ